MMIFFWDFEFRFQTGFGVENEQVLKTHKNAVKIIDIAAIFFLVRPVKALTPPQKKLNDGRSYTPFDLARWLAFWLSFG